MRNGLLFLLLAGSAMPALAAPEDDERAARREAMRAERAEARSERALVRAQPSTRMERSIVRDSAESGGEDRAVIREQRREAVEPQAVERRRPRFVEVESGRSTLEQSREPLEQGAMGRRSAPVVEIETARPALEQRREAVQQRARERRGPRIVEVDSAAPVIEQRKGVVDGVREWRRAERDRARRPALVEQRTDTGWEPLRKREEQTVGAVTGIRRAPIVSRIPREGTQPPGVTAARAAGQAARHWRGDWRNDHRYDWRKHRRRHRSLFHFGFYYDPFGWGYRPYSIGWRLWPSYYRSRYWLHDPWMYRLPVPPPGYRWIRYYDDALLVDTWDGRVVDVIRNFFW